MLWKSHRVSQMIAQLMDLRSYRCWLWWAYWVIWGDLWILIDLDRSHCDINTEPLIPNLINKDTRWGYWETFKDFNFIIFISISLHVRIMATTSSPSGHTLLEWQKFIHYDCNQQRRGGGCGLRFFFINLQFKRQQWWNYYHGQRWPAARQDHFIISHVCINFPVTNIENGWRRQADEQYLSVSPIGDLSEFSVRLSSSPEE